MPGMGLTLSPDPTPVLILAVSSAFITTIVSTTDYTLNNNIQVVQEKSIASGMHDSGGDRSDDDATVYTI